jgi:hypothetical protein
MTAEDRVPLVSWVVLGVLVLVSALAVLAACRSVPLAATVILVGLGTALGVAFVLRAHGAAGAPAEPAAGEYRAAA